MIKAENNQYERRIATTTNLTQAASPYYYPTSAGMDHGGFIDWSVSIAATCGAGNTQTFTVEISDDAATWIDVTRAGYDCVTNTSGNASYVCAASGTLSAKVDFDGLNTRYVRLKNTVVDGGAASNSSTCNTRDSGLLGI